MTSICKSQNVCDFLSRRARGDSVSFQSFLQKRLKKNRPTPIICKDHLDTIIAIKIRHPLAVTLSLDKTVKAWDLFRMHCLWTFAPSPQIIWHPNIHISDEVVVCGGILSYFGSLRTKEIIYIINLQSGKEIGQIAGHGLRAQYRTLIQKKIFCALSSGHIGEWTLTGEYLRSIPSGKITHLSAKFFSQEHLLVQTTQQNILIHDTSANVNISFSLKYLILTAKIEGSILLTISKKVNQFYVCIMDLKIRRMITKYRTSRDLPSQVLVHQESAYVGLASGQLVALGLRQKSQKLFGQHPGPVDFFIKKDNMLISGCNDLSGKAEVTFWNMQTLKKIATVRFPSLSSLSFHSGRLLAAVDNTLVQYDLFS